MLDTRNDPCRVNKNKPEATHHQAASARCDIGSPSPIVQQLKAEIAAVANTIIECEAGSVTVDFAALKRHLLRLSAI